MYDFTFKLNKNKNQRIINGFIFVCITSWVLLNLNYVYYSSSYYILIKYDFLKLLGFLFFLQTILNKLWINQILILLFCTLLVFVFFECIYSCYLREDFVFQKENGILIKIWGTCLKSSILILLIWIIHRMKPIEKNV